MRRGLLATACVASALLGCGDDPVSPPPDNGQKPDGTLTVVRFDPVLFQSAQKTGSFWAVKGEDRELELLYDDSSGPGSDEFLEFEVDADALLQRPDGTFFQEGDSILITVTVDPEGDFLFDFQPSGLRFNPDEPAELEVNFSLADPDVNRDGVVDAEDVALREALEVWQQESLGEDWIRLLTLRIRDDEIRADVGGFTTFAAAN